MHKLRLGPQPLLTIRKPKEAIPDHDPSATSDLSVVDGTSVCSQIHSADTRPGNGNRTSVDSAVDSLVQYSVAQVCPGVGIDQAIQRSSQILGESWTLPSSISPRRTGQSQDCSQVGSTRPPLAGSKASAENRNMSSTVESLISELDLAISACVGRDHSSSESSDALESLRTQVQSRATDIDFDTTSIRRITSGLALPSWMPLSIQSKIGREDQYLPLSALVREILQKPYGRRECTWLS